VPQDWLKFGSSPFSGQSICGFRTPCLPTRVRRDRNRPPGHSLPLVRGISSVLHPVLAAAGNHHTFITCVPLSDWHGGSLWLHCVARRPRGVPSGAAVAYSALHPHDSRLALFLPLLVAKPDGLTLVRALVLGV